MKFHSRPIEEHQEVPLADDGQWEALVERWAQRALRPAGGASTTTTRKTASTSASEATARRGSACYVVCVGDWEYPEARAAQLAELLALVQAQGDEVVGHETLQRRRVDARTYISSGVAREIAARARERGANMLVLDAELSPSQTRNLEDASGFAICDREIVILNVFLKHARTRRARIQVEIAQLEYLRPRIRGLGLEMDQQAGGIMRGRGPGETASELLARRLDGRLSELRKAFTKLERAGAQQRQRRRSCARVVLVGYTNAGKTSLMNALTGAELSARDMPFETLDTTSRSLTRHGGDVVISDTVGFIRKLPPRLLASFESTLAEAREASLLAVVLDVSDPEWEMHAETTALQLARLGAEQIPRLYVFNKLDRVDVKPARARLRSICGPYPYTLVSSRDAGAVARLKQTLIKAARGGHQRARVFIPYEATEVARRVYAECRVLDSRAEPHGLRMLIEGPERVVAQIRRAGQEAARC